MIDVKIFVDAKKFTKYFNIPKHIFFWRSQVTRKNNLPPKKESPQKKIHPPKKYPPPKKKSTPEKKNPPPHPCATCFFFHAVTG
jgi:hypothetical protein